jgi:3-deoxy-D-manno-octulosonate 8-phosphate phosphatase (KDO 8-P phosphatase)
MKRPLSIAHPAEALVLARLEPSVRARLERLKLMVFDVDGVLTDAGLWYTEQGETIKRFNALDGHGLKMLAVSGIQVALVTGRESPIIARRAAELGLGAVMQNVRDKGAVLTELCARYSVTLEQTGFMGDDLIDLPAMQRAGFSASVPDAPIYIIQAAHWVAERRGGHGAARECCDLILAAQQRLGAFFQPGLLGSGPVQ